MIRTIDITTTQGVTIGYELAKLQERIVAFIIDQLLLGATMLVSWLLFSGFFGFDASSFFYLGILLPVYAFYTPVCEIFMDGQSFGKRAVGTKIVKLTGDAPSVDDYLMRWAFRLIDVWLSGGTIAAMLVSSSPKAQRLGGIASNTVVIRVRFSMQFRLEDIENISSAETYQVVYPQVRKLAEADVLLIKSILSQKTQYHRSTHDAVLQALVLRLVQVLELPKMPQNYEFFLRTVVRDYIVSTR